MQDCIFKQLVIDTYNIKQKSDWLVGIIYGSISSNGFSDITDINGYMNTMNPSMLYLKSKATGLEINIYEWELESYKIENDKNTIYIKLKEKCEVGIMF